MFKKIIIIFCLFVLTACTDNNWNNPYRAGATAQNVLFASFSERPKHLDPVRSYSASEYAFLAQIYEPPLQYHYLKRPYQLIPVTITEVPKAVFLNQQKQPIETDNPQDVAYSEYIFEVKKGIFYQPHPALATDKQGKYLYHHLAPSTIESVYNLNDFKYTGTRELTAADYVYQVKRIALPALSSPINGVMQGYIDGFKTYSNDLKVAWNKQKKNHQHNEFWLDLRQYPLDSVTILDRYHYKIRIKGVYPQFLYWMAMPFFAPMPWEADAFYQQKGLKKKNISLNWYPIGTGPYLLSENNPNLRMVLEKNPNFHNEFYPSEGEPHDQAILKDAGKKLPFIDKVIYSLEKESIPKWTKFLQGYYDNSGISSDSFDQAVQTSGNGDIGLTDKMAEKGIKLSTSTETSIFYIGFNMLDDVIGGTTEQARYLRQAISIAIDYEEYIAIFANGRGIAAQGILPPGIFGHRTAEQGINPIVYDWINGKLKRKSIEQAKQLMIKAGYENGVDQQTGKALTLYFDTARTGPDSKAYLNWMIKQFKKIDIELVIRTSDYNRFQTKMRQGKAQIFEWGWNADYPDPENFFFLLYGKNGKVAHHGENAANYDNPEFNQKFEAMKTMKNTPERQQLIDQLQQLIRTDAPWVFGYHPQSYVLYHQWYENVKPNIMANNTLKYKRVNGSLRANKQQAWNQPIIWPFILILFLIVAGIMPAIRYWLQKEQGGGISKV